MNPEDIAMKFASASATCGGKCPYTSECKGTRETCLMKEVALIIRAEMAEITKLRAEYETIKQCALTLTEYIHALEKVNNQYYRLVTEFQKGYRQRKKIKKRVPHIGSARGRKKKDPIEMDGDERYAMPKEKKEEQPPVVMI